MPCGCWVCAGVEGPGGEFFFAHLAPEAITDSKAPDEDGQEEGTERAEGRREHDGIVRVVAITQVISKATLAKIDGDLRVARTRPMSFASIQSYRE